MDTGSRVSRCGDGQDGKADWGEIRWKFSDELSPGCEMTLGICTIGPGRRNPLHSHPNCEEILYVLAGTCRHRLNDQEVDLGPGDAIRIPRNVEHWASCTSADPLSVLIIFSSPSRKAIFLEAGAPIPSSGRAGNGI